MTPVRIQDSLLAAFSLRYSCMPASSVQMITSSFALLSLSFVMGFPFRAHKKRPVISDPDAPYICSCYLILSSLRSVIGSRTGGVSGEDLRKRVLTANPINISAFFIIWHRPFHAASVCVCRRTPWQLPHNPPSWRQAGQAGKAFGTGPL